MSAGPDPVAEADLREAVRQCLDSHADIRRFVAEPGTGVRTYDAGLYQRLTGMGLAGLLIPERLGGSGGDMAAAAAAFEELGKSLAPVPLLATAGLAVPAILAATGYGKAVNESAAGLLRDIAAGSVVATLAVTEANGSYQPALTSAIAWPDGDSWAVSGAKHFVLDGAAAGVLLVPARVGGGGDEVGLFALQSTATGVDVRALPGLDLLRGLAQLDLNHAQARLVGRPSAAGRGLSSALDLGLLLLAAEQIGGARQCLAAAVAYAGQRVQFGRPIGSFQALQHLLVDLLLDLEMASAALGSAVAVAADYLADPRPDGERGLAEVTSLARSMCSDAYMRIADEALHVHGGIGFTWEHNSHLYYRRAKVTELLFGSPYEHRERLAALAGLGT